MNVLPDELLWLDLYVQVTARNSEFNDDQLHGIMCALGDAMFDVEDLSTIHDVDENFILSLSLFGDMFLEEQAVDG